MSEKEPAIEKIAEETGRDVEQGLTGIAPPDGDHAHKRKRTWGNKIFDLAVWPTIAFGAVFGFSVWATHKAKFGSGWAREKFDRLADTIEKSPFIRQSLPDEVRKEEAGNHALVLVSFVIGTLLMAPIKWFEDARGKISQWLDKKHRSLHDDPSHYLKEPKQSWKSVLGGRAITFGSVLLLSKAVGDYIIDVAHAAANKISGIQIIEKGMTEAEKKIAEASAGRRWQYAFISSFEAFYTALCAISVYATSRGLARLFNNTEAQPEAPTPPRAAFPAEASGPAAGAASWQEKAGPRPQPQKAEGFVRAVGDGRRVLSAQPALPG